MIVQASPDVRIGHCKKKKNHILGELNKAVQRMGCDFRPQSTKSLSVHILLAEYDPGSV